MSKKVLIIDDDKLARNSLTSAVTGYGIEVFDADNGEEGLKKAKQLMPDLIVTDIYMPKLDGLAMVEQLRASEWGKDIPVIIMTTDNSTQTLYKALKGGVSTYLSKTSLDVDAFAVQIKQALGV